MLIQLFFCTKKRLHHQRLQPFTAQTLLPQHPYPVAPAGGRLRHRNRPAPAGSPDNHPTAVRLVAGRAAVTAASVAASAPQSHPAALRPELTDENQSSGAAAYQ